MKPDLFDLIIAGIGLVFNLLLIVLLVMQRRDILKHEAAWKRRYDEF